MKGYDFDAVVYDGEVYCVGCLPEGVNPTSEGVIPIFASDEWELPPVCERCGAEHDYMGVLAHKCRTCGRYTMDELLRCEDCGRDICPDCAVKHVDPDEPSVVWHTCPDCNE